MLPAHFGEILRVACPEQRERSQNDKPEHRAWLTSAVLVATCIVLASGCRRAQVLPPSEATRSPNLDVVQLDSGVFAAIRKEPLSLAVNSNSLIIVRDTDVVVVD